MYSVAIKRDWKKMPGLCTSRFAKSQHRSSDQMLPVIHVHRMRCPAVLLETSLSRTAVEIHRPPVHN